VLLNGELIDLNEVAIIYPSIGVVIELHERKCNPTGVAGCLIALKRVSKCLV